MLFAQAEAAQLGWISGSAQTFYEAGIKASMEQWGTYTADAYAKYIAQSDVAFTSAKAIEQITTLDCLILSKQRSMGRIMAQNRVSRVETC